MTAPEVEALEAERDFLLQSIRDLDAERAAGELDERDYKRLRDDYTARAAAVLRSLDSGVDRGRPAPPDHSRAWRVVVGVVAVGTVAVLAGLAMSASSGERLAGEQVSGSVAEGNNSKIARAQQLVSEGEVLEAIQLYDEVLRDDPDHPVALAQRGWLVSRAGLLDEGLVYVDRAIAAEPRYAEARFFRALILREKGDTGAAADELRAFLALNPPPELRTLAEDTLANLRQ
jgi:tetratricopeptide (TPR) repeat protein